MKSNHVDKNKELTELKNDLVLLEIKELKLINKVQNIKTNNYRYEEQIISKQKQLEKHRSDLRSIQNKNSWLEKRVHLMKSSNSWKITEFVRKIGGIFKRN